MNIQSIWSFHIYLICCIAIIIVDNNFSQKWGQDRNDKEQGQALMLDTFVDMAVQQKIVLIFQNAANRTL